MNLFKTPVDKKQKIQFIVGFAFFVMSLIFLICVFVFIFVSSRPQNQGYDKIQNRIQSGLANPDSYKVISVYYKEDKRKQISDGAVYQYKVYFKCKNQVGMDIYKTVYYGYCPDIEEAIYKYGSFDGVFKYENSFRYETTLAYEEVRLR